MMKLMKTALCVAVVLLILLVIFQRTSSSYVPPVSEKARKFFEKQQQPPVPITQGPSGWDFPGYDISEMDGAPQDCAQSCKKASGCVGFVHAPSANHCWLKSQMMLGGQNSDRVPWLMP